MTERSTGAPIIELKDVDLVFGAERLYAGLSFDVREGEFLCLLGPSGCGKSTILRLMSGLIDPSGGAVYVRGKPPHAMRNEFAFVFQSPRLVPWRSALDNVCLASTLRYGTSKKQATHRAVAELGRVGLGRDVNKMPAMMSGGERQRVSIARALVVDPVIVLMDEPFSALDVRTRNLMRAEIVRLWRETKKTVVFVTHDIDDAMLLADRVVVFSAKPTVVVETIDIVAARPRAFETSPELKTIRAKLTELLHQSEALADVSA